MTGTSGLFADEALLQALGEELRRARHRAGWSRPQLAQRMHTGVQSRTIATYEHGTRQCTVPRLVEICRAVDVPAPELLALALRRAEVDAHFWVVQVDLSAVLADEREHTGPLRQWATMRLSGDSTHGNVARLERGAVQEMAVLLNYRHTELVQLLAEFAPRMQTATPNRFEHASS